MNKLIIKVLFYMLLIVLFFLGFFIAFRTSDDNIVKKIIAILIPLLITLISSAFDIIHSIRTIENSQYGYRKYLVNELENNGSHNINSIILDEVEKEESNEISKQVSEKDDSTTTNEQKKNDNKDIIALMLKNNDEITDYFKISKSQARSSFLFSVIICIVGIAALFAGIYGIVAINDVSVSVISLISGAISEVISGTIFWLHNKSALQLNHYYDALHENEKFLSAISIADKLGDEKREEMLVEIIRKQISDKPIAIQTENKIEKES